LDPSIVQPTVPRAFHFETEDRESMKPKKPLSSAELELLEFTKEPKFKAQPWDRRIVEAGGTIGIKKVDKLPLTVPQVIILINFIFTYIFLKGV
jgi:hypothetical protein